MVIIQFIITKPGLHWNKVPEAHKEIKDNINPILMERSFWWYIVRVISYLFLFPSLERTL